MSRYLLLLPAPEAAWATLPASEHEKGMRSHQRFHADLRNGGHTLVATSPLEPSAHAVTMRPGSNGAALVQSGPCTASEEQVVGFYLIETDDEPGLFRIVEDFAARGEIVEIRKLTA